MEPSQQNNSLKKQKKGGSVISFFQKPKILLLILTVLVLFVIGFKVKQLKNDINRPLNVSTTENTSCSSGECKNKQEEQDEQKRKRVDTDKDGLTDREEREIYNTSPYLKDTDSDGLTDKEEVERGSDPNCPQGKKCNNEFTPSQEDQEEKFSPKESIISTSSEVRPETVSTENTKKGSTSISGKQIPQKQDLSAENVDQETLKQIMQGEGDASSLRKALKEAGMNDTLLKKMSDEQLIQSYQKALEKTQNSSP